jgi:hypothetical protein
VAAYKYLEDELKADQSWKVSLTDRAGIIKKAETSDPAASQTGNPQDEAKLAGTINIAVPPVDRLLQASSIPTLLAKPRQLSWTQFVKRMATAPRLACRRICPA